MGLPDSSDKDAHSKWQEVVPMGVCSPLTTIQALRTLFAQFGIPETIVSDNGPQFVAREFENFCKANGVQPPTILPQTDWQRGLYIFSRRV